MDFRFKMAQMAFSSRFGAFFGGEFSGRINTLQRGRRDGSEAFLLRMLIFYFATSRKVCNFANAKKMFLEQPCHRNSNAEKHVCIIKNI